MPSWEVLKGERLNPQDSFLYGTKESQCLISWVMPDC